MMRQSQRLDPHQRARRIFISNQRNMRAYNPKTQQWLHVSGLFDVDNTEFAWIGSERQFQRLLNWDKRKNYVLVDSRKTLPSLANTEDTGIMGERYGHHL